MASQPPLEREDPFSVGARRHRVHSGHRLESRRRRREVQAGRPSLAGNRGHRARHGARRQPRARRLRAGRLGLRDREPFNRLSNHAEGARRRLPARSPPSLDSIGKAGRDPSRAPRGRQRGARFLQRSGIHPRRHAHFHAGRVRRHDNALPCRLLRRPESLSDAERTAVRRGQRHGARPRLQLRPGVPRGEIEDAPAPHRVLDGRARDGVRDARRRDRSRRGTRRRGRLTRAREAAARAQGARARHVEARTREGAVPAHLVRRGGEDSARQGTALRMGRRSWRHRRDDSVAALRPAGGDSPVSGKREAVLHGIGSPAARARAVRRHARARGHRRDHRRQPAPRELRRAAAAHQGSQSPAGSVRVVSRPAPLRIGAARRFRHGHRAGRRMDLRPRARARSYAVPANDVPGDAV